MAKEYMDGGVKLNNAFAVFQTIDFRRIVNAEGLAERNGCNTNEKNRYQVGEMNDESNLR
jgi:hypothetical protein